MTGPELFDPGLQPERTWLAWRRTLLGLVVGSLLELRLLPPLLGAWSLAVGLVGLAVCAVLGVLARRRMRRMYRVLVREPAPLPDARLLLGLGAAVTVLGAVAAGAILVR